MVVVKEQYRLARREAVRRAVGQLQAACSVAVLAPTDVFRDVNCPASARVSAARTVLEAPSIEGAFSFQRHPYRGSHRGYWDGGGMLAESLGKSYPWALGFSFGNTELSLELWTVISGISGFDD